jgi:glycosyltransferase involved in cell wall biosynthesis
VNLKKIALIGPVYPFKGGISHYNSLLYRALAKKHNVKMISFKLQYPFFLYPSESQKSFSSNHFKIDDTDYAINSMNPLSWALAAMNIIKYAPDLIIFHWWNPYFGPCFTFISLLLKLFSRSRIMFICHNVLPHEKMPLSNSISKLTLSTGNCFIVHSEKDAKKLLRIIPDANYIKAFLPTFNIFNLDDMSQHKAREILNIKNKKVILFFGFIRKYKGLIYLIRALPKVVECYPDILLLIVGDFYDAKEKYLTEIKTLALDDCIDIYDGYIPDREVGVFFSASDLVVLPYISATQSGIVQIAYGFEKPVIVTDVGGLPEVVEDGRTGYLVKPADSSQIADSIIKFFMKNSAQEFSDNIKDRQSRYAWERLAQNIEELGGL